MTERGTVTFPAEVRNALGIKGKQSFLMKLEEDGSINLRLAELYPVEIYTDARIAEFERDEPVVRAFLDSLKK